LLKREPFNPAPKQRVEPFQRVNGLAEGQIDHARFDRGEGDGVDQDGRVKERGKEIESKAPAEPALNLLHLDLHPVALREIHQVIEQLAPYGPLGALRNMTRDALGDGVTADEIHNACRIWLQRDAQAKKYHWKYLMGIARNKPQGTVGPPQPDPPLDEVAEDPEAAERFKALLMGLAEGLKNRHRLEPARPELVVEKPKPKPPRTVTPTQVAKARRFIERQNLPGSLLERLRTDTDLVRFAAAIQPGESNST